MHARAERRAVCENMASAFGTTIVSAPGNTTPFSSSSVICMRIDPTKFEGSASSSVSVTELIAQYIYTPETFGMFRMLHDETPPKSCHKHRMSHRT